MLPHAYRRSAGCQGLQLPFSSRTRKKRVCSARVAGSPALVIASMRAVSSSFQSIVAMVAPPGLLRVRANSVFQAGAATPHRFLRLLGLTSSGSKAGGLRAGVTSTPAASTLNAALSASNTATRCWASGVAARWSTQARVGSVVAMSVRFSEVLVHGIQFCLGEPLNTSQQSF